MSPEWITITISGTATFAAFAVPIGLHISGVKRDAAKRSRRAENISTMVISELAGLVPSLKAVFQCKGAVESAENVERLEPLKSRLDLRETPIIDSAIDWIDDMDRESSAKFSEVYAQVSQAREALREVYSTEIIHVAQYRYKRLEQLTEYLLSSIKKFVQTTSHLKPELSEMFIAELDAELNRFVIHDTRKV